MTAEIGHFVNMVYLDQSGNLHLNGAKVLDANEVDITLQVQALPQYTFTGGITAHAGGGQQASSSLASVVNRVTTVATIGDSVTLPVAPATGSLEITVANAAANSANVFPNTGDTINALGANAAFALAGGKTATFFSCGTGQWHAQLTA